MERLWQVGLLLVLGVACNAEATRVDLTARGYLPASEEFAPPDIRALHTYVIVPSSSQRVLEAWDEVLVGFDVDGERLEPARIERGACESDFCLNGLFLSKTQQGTGVAVHVELLGRDELQEIFRSWQEEGGGVPICTISVVLGPDGVRKASLTSIGFEPGELLYLR